jgi:hypothetical protein
VQRISDLATGTIAALGPPTFVGPTVSVTASNGQWITAVVTASLGIHPAMTSLGSIDYSRVHDVGFAYGICTQPVGGSPSFISQATLGVIPAVESNDAHPFVASAGYQFQPWDVAPGQATFQVGFCVTYSTAALDANDAVSGWVQLFN